MPQITKTFEFDNPYVTRNTYTTKPGITFPQMVDGRRPPPILTFYSTKQAAGDYYNLPNLEHTVAYCIEGGFIGTCTMQITTTPAPGENDWVDLPETKHEYIGLETTGGAGISGGFSGAVSRPIQTDTYVFTGTYAWIRAKLDICRGTLQSIRLNF
jgi:hypothetical protein